MPSRNDDTRAIALLASCALGACLVWALWPMPETAPVPGLREPERRSPDPETEAAPLDRAAFAARIWNPPIDQATDSQPRSEPTDPPITLQLIGIAEEALAGGGVVLRAALYDPSDDRLHLLASGDRLGQVSVTAVDAAGVELASGTRTARLELHGEDGR